ncbi:unnamed protein product, partial [Protopolystoma xenopodis]
FLLLPLPLSLHIPLPFPFPFSLPPSLPLPLPLPLPPTPPTPPFSSPPPPSSPPSSPLPPFPLPTFPPPPSFQDTCKGDSGGGLFCKAPDTNRWQLYGITSYGGASGCGRTYSIYMSVPAASDWIKRVIARYGKSAVGQADADADDDVVDVDGMFL